jgi:hypothetical protein
MHKYIRNIKEICPEYAQNIKQSAENRQK